MCIILTIEIGSNWNMSDYEQDILIEERSQLAHKI